MVQSLVKSHTKDELFCTLSTSIFLFVKEIPELVLIFSNGSCENLSRDSGRSRNGSFLPADKALTALVGAMQAAGRIVIDSLVERWTL